MAQDDTSAQPSTAVATQDQPRRPAKLYAPVEAASSIMDTARFEHLGRVATLMATARLMPESLTHYKDGDGPNARMIEHEFSVIQARAFLIATQADNWKADPNAVAQCTSLVHNRLMYEGKLVHGIIETRIGVRLRYEFGVYNPRTRDIDPLPQGGLDPTDKTLGVRVSGKFDDEDFVRWVAGSVAMWETTGNKSPWSKNAAWPRQLRYMGAREWGRAHSPSLLLGILTDDEIEGYESIQDQRAARAERRAPKAKDDIAGKLAGPGQNQGAGFSEAHVAGETDAGAPEAAQGGHDTETGELTDDTTQGPQADAIAAGAGQDSVTGDGPDAAEDEVWPFSKRHEGPAPADVTYQLSTDEVGDDDKMQCYRNGQPLQRYGALACAEIPLYDAHPEDVTAEVTIRGADVVNITPSSDPEVDPPTFMDRVRALEDWPSIRAEFTALNKTEAFKEADTADQNDVRAAIWAHVDTLIKAGKVKLDVITDLAAFRLWIETETGKDGAVAIEANFRLLKREPLWNDANEATRDRVEAAVVARIAKLHGAA